MIKALGKVCKPHQRREDRPNQQGGHFSGPSARGPLKIVLKKEYMELLELRAKERVPGELCLG